MVRRLARRARQAPRQSPPHQEGSQGLLSQDAPTRSSKKRPALGDVAGIAKTWAEGFSKHSIYSAAARALIDVAGHLQPRQLRPETAQGIAARWKAQLAQSTAHNRTYALGKLLRALERYGSPAIADQLPRIRRGQPRPRIAEPGEIERLLTFAPPHVRLFALLCWQLALRFREAVSITPQLFNQDEHTVSIPVKGHKFRTLPTTPDIEQLFAAAGDAAGEQTIPYVWLLHTRRPMCKEAMRDAWQRACKKARVEGLHPHDLRRTTATDLYRTTKDLRAVQQYLGHTSLMTTTAYLAPLKEEQLREYHKLLHFTKKETA